MNLEEMLEKIDEFKTYDIMELLIEKIESELNKEYVEIMKIKDLKGDAINEYMKKNYDNYKKLCYNYDKISKMYDFLVNCDYLEVLE